MIQSTFNVQGSKFFKQFKLQMRTNTHTRTSQYTREGDVLAYAMREQERGGGIDRVILEIAAEEGDPVLPDVNV